MAKPSPNQLRGYLTLAVLFFETAHLAWESLHGGVVSHNLLNRRDLPAISNWWGLAFLPMLAWFMVGRVQSRDPFIGKAAVIRFLVALFYATCLATAFRWGYEATTSTLFFGMILLAVVIPLYKAEYIFGLCAWHDSGVWRDFANANCQHPCCDLSGAKHARFGYIQSVSKTLIRQP